ncbi:MAG: hypothetical protein WCO93_08350 [bacterium]
MKTKIFIIGALVLLLGVIIYILIDLFSAKPVARENPFDYGMEEIKKSDSNLKVYREVSQVRPGMEEIYGLATGPCDRIYVTGKGGVEVYDSSGNIVYHFPVDGNPGPVTIGRQGMIWLGVEDHIEVTDSAGKVIKKWKAANDASIITGIAVSGQNVFVADAGNKVVYRYDLSGKQMNRIGEKDPQNNIPGFVIPSPWFDLGIDKEGFLWVVNPGRHQFEKYSFDGKLLSKWGMASNTIDGFCGCCNPSHFAFLGDGSFVTSEKGIERVKVYSPEGDFRWIVASPDLFVEGTKGLDIAVDSRNRILVLDPGKKLVRIFKKIETAEN